MHWNYRLMRREHSGETTVAIHEVFYDDNGDVDGWTEGPCQPMGASPDGLLDDLKTMLEAFDQPVLDYETGKADKASKETA